MELYDVYVQTEDGVILLTAQPVPMNEVDRLRSIVIGADKIITILVPSDD